MIGGAGPRWPWGCAMFPVRGEKGSQWPQPGTPMPVIVTSTITARCWKQHTCTACGCVYQYLFERTRSASGGTGEDTSGKARLKLARALRNGIDECPCPTCGIIQADMVARDKVT